ncbi:MAG: oxidoreductase [Pseudomonadota bacterium]
MAKRLHKSGFKNWTPDRLPSLSGTTFLITGGNSGIGFEAAKMLAAAGGRLVIAARNPAKAADAVQTLADMGAPPAETLSLDLSDLSYVRAAADEARARFPRLDALINNAGIMQTPQTTTKDGFELQFATNHLGHFLFAGLLFGSVQAAAGRIVAVASIAHKYGAINFDDLMLTDEYTPTRAYCQSKLANVLFALELDRRLQAKNSPAMAVACHPGYSATNLQSTGPRGFLKALYGPLNALLAQPAYNGAIPTVLAAAGEEAKAGGYYGPQDMREARGRVSDATVSKAGLDKEAAARLWDESERLVDFRWPL